MRILKWLKVKIYIQAQKDLLKVISNEFQNRRDMPSHCSIDDGWDACYDELMMFAHTYVNK